MNESKLSSRPPSMGEGRNALDDFIGGASVPSAEPAASESYPWDAPGVRADVAKVFNLRLPEPYLRKLKYIAEHTPDSMQSFCLDVLLPAIDSFSPDLLLISAGFDGHRADPLAQFQLETDDFAWVTRELAELAGRRCGGRVVSLLEGGYDLSALAQCAAAHVRELEAA